MNTLNYEANLAQEEKLKRKKRHPKEHWQLTSMLAPGMIYVLIFSYLPMIGLILAFKKFKMNLGIFKSPWCGFDNFEFIFKTNTFWTLVRNTFVYNIVFILLGLFFAVLLAIALEKIRKRSLIKIYQSTMMIPHFISWLVVSNMCYAFLAVDSGMINSILTSMGLKEISFYTETKYWPFIFLIFNIWKNAGYNAMIYYGSILDIDTSLFESASLDGCSELGKIRYITLPHLMPTICTLTIMSIGRICYSDFGMFFYLPKDTGALYKVTDVMDTYIMRVLRTTGSFSDSSAVAFLQSVVGLICVLTANHIVKKINSDSSLF